MTDLRLPDRIAFARHELATITGLSSAFWDSQFAAGNIAVRTGGGHEIVLRTDVERVLSSLPTKTFISEEERAAAARAEAVAKFARGREIRQQAYSGGNRDPRREKGRQITENLLGKKEPSK